MGFTGSNPRVPISYENVTISPFDGIGKFIFDSGTCKNSPLGLYNC